MSRLTRDGRAELGTGGLNSCRETKFSGTHGDRGILFFPVQLTTSRIGNLARLIHTLLYVMTIHIYIHTYVVPRIAWKCRQVKRLTEPQIAEYDTIDPVLLLLNEYYPLL